MKLLRAISFYADVLRPSWVFAILIVALPLTALYDIAGSSMLGNLFEDYGFEASLIFGATIFSATWALLLTAGLSLDAFRDRRQRARAAQGKPTPPETYWLTIPLERVSPVLAFSSLALPGAFATVAHSSNRLEAAIGFVAGGFAAYALMDVAISWIRLADHRLRIMPWDPFFGSLIVRTFPRWIVRVLAFIPSRLIDGLTRVSRILNLPDHLYDSRGLKGDHVLVILSLVWMLLIWCVLYVVLGPDGRYVKQLDDLPPAGFVYFLILFFILFISPLSMLLRRRRLLLPTLVAWMFLMNILQSVAPQMRLGAFLIGHPAHTYDVYAVGKQESVTTLDLLAGGKAAGGKRPLIVVAASGGGILAAGWTAKVLAELHSEYSEFRKNLWLISAVSGGSVGTAYYLNALDRFGDALDVDRLRQVIEAATTTSLSAAAYGFAFPDLRRFLFPLLTPQLDRARIQEARWQRIAMNGSGDGKRVLQPIADWNDKIRHRQLPAFIFNATVMETGERIAITPLSSLRHLGQKPSAEERAWPGWTPVESGGDPLPVRRTGARTLSEFLGKADDYTIDLWTAARLSATFSYVSPPASARLCDSTGCGALPPEGKPRDSWNTFAPLHLIDGGYNENYGVASALDWITRVVRHCAAGGACPFDRIALVEIRATPVKIREAPDAEWLASWLGPPLGIMNSWAFAQTSANDTAVERLIAALNETSSGIKVESFVFEPEVGAGEQVLAKDWCKADAKRCCCLLCCAEKYEGVDKKATRRFSLSWHLSAAERKRIYEYWRDPQNQCAFGEFLRFVGQPAHQNADTCVSPIQNVLPQS